MWLPARAAWRSYLRGSMLTQGMLKKSDRENRQQKSRPVEPCRVSALRLSTCGPEAPASASPGSLGERQILSPKPDRLSQVLWGWGRWGRVSAFGTRGLNKHSRGLPCAFRCDHYHCTRTTLVVKTNRRTKIKIKQEGSEAPVLQKRGHLARMQEKI